MSTSHTAGGNDVQLFNHRVCFEAAEIVLPEHDLSEKVWQYIIFQWTHMGGGMEII